MSMFHAAMGSPPQTFQTYLLPALPFRRRRSSTDTSPRSSAPSSASSSISTSPMSPSSSISSSSISSSSTSSNYSFFASTTLPLESVRSAIVENQPNTYLSGSTSHISCSRCHADLALTSQIISKGFTGRHGRAYLVAGAASPSKATTRDGHASATILPNTHTHKPMPRHLVTGLHTVCDISCAMCGCVIGWKYIGAEDESQRYKVGKFILETRRVTVGSVWENDEYDDDLEEDVVKSPDADDIAFDSQDEDECEDLFSGIWTPQLAKRRRDRRVAVRPGS